MKQVSIAEEQKLKDVRLGEVVPNVLEEVSAPVVPKSYHYFVLSMKQSKNSFVLHTRVHEFAIFFANKNIFACACYAQPELSLNNGNNTFVVLTCMRQSGN